MKEEMGVLTAHEVNKLKRLMETSTMTFCIWQTINGTIVKREA